MKKLLTFAAMFLCSLTTFAQYSGSGSGTESDPYKIMNPIQLNQLRNYLNTQGVYFKIMSDIDLTDFLEDENPSQGWQPVGNSSSAAFKGILDGNGKKITGLWVNRSTTDNVGLFGYTSGATIKNLSIEATTIKGKDNVGGVSGYSESTTINAVSFSGKIEGGSNIGGFVGSSGDKMVLSSNTSTIEISASGDYVGGLIGKNDAGSNLSITDCKVNNGSISGNNHVGGACGGILGSHYSSNNISNSYVHAVITGAQRVGGFSGSSEDYTHTLNLSNCGYIGNIKGDSYVGGLIGYLKKTYHDLVDSQTCCFAIGSITANDYVGGLIGYDYGYYDYNGRNNVTNSYFSGTVSGTNYVGGITGYKYKGTISKCYSTATVIGTKYVGGLMGFSKDATINTSVANNPRVMATEGDVARIVGHNEGSIAAVGSTEENKSYNRTIVIDQGVAYDINDDQRNGTGVSATTLKLKATYVAMGWNFTNDWEIQETECYPYMKIQTAPPVITSQLKSGATTISGKCVDGGTVTLEVDGVKKQMVSSGNLFSFNVSPLQAGHEVRICAKADGKEQSYYTTEMVVYLGSGKENDPYQVYSASDLTGVYRKGYFKLMNDIDLTDYINQFSPTEGWQSIGRDGSETIHFDGNGHKITGLWCNTTRDNTGLFSCFANGTIKNLTVETAKNKQVKGGANTGILIGKMMNGTIENCKVSGTVTDGTPVGGIIGLMDKGTITLSQSSVTINTTGNKSYVGGIVGEITSGVIDQCVTNGFYTAEGSESYVGGLVGKNSATIVNCYSNATITSTYSSAGVVAYNYGIVENCYATGNIFSSNFGAGVVGYNDGENAIVRNCVAMNNKIDVTYESQQVQQGGGYGMRIVGGYKNGAPDPELNNYALKTMQVSVNNVPQKVYDDLMNGVGKTGEELVTSTTYQELGWDFSDTWSIVEEGNYPSLQSNEAAVTKPGEEPEPEPDPEPVVSATDKISVPEVKGHSSSTIALSIDLENTATNLTAYQFDLTLPEGITLATNESGKFLVTKTSRYADDEQSLTITKLEDNTYRFVCFSMYNSVITGTSGAILNAILDVATTVNAATHEGKISDILFTKSNGDQLKMNEAKFNIVISSYILGDANADGTVNVSDIVEMVNYIMNNASSRFVKVAADVNEDGDVNVTDIVAVVNIILNTTTNNARAVTRTENTDNDQLSLAVNADKSVSLMLDNNANYVASQFELILAEGQQLNSITLNSNRCSGHIMSYSKIANNKYRVMIYSLDNSSYTGNSGELVNINVEGEGEFVIDKILFVTKGQAEKYFSSIGGNGTTGIGIINAEDVNNDIYTIDGRLVRSKANNTSGLAKGVYIINGKKHVVK
jgi:hypothetical protein